MALLRPELEKLIVASGGLELKLSRRLVEIVEAAPSLAGQLVVGRGAVEFKVLLVIEVVVFVLLIVVPAQVHVDRRRRSRAAQLA